MIFRDGITACGIIAMFPASPSSDFPLPPYLFAFLWIPFFFFCDGYAILETNG